MSVCEALRDWVWGGNLEHVDGGGDGDPAGVMLGGYFSMAGHREPAGHQPWLRQDRGEPGSHLPPRPLRQGPPASRWHSDAVRRHPLIFRGLWSTRGALGSPGRTWRVTPAPQHRAGGLAVQSTLGAGILPGGCPSAAKPESSQGPCLCSGERGADSLRSCPDHELLFSLSGCAM